MIKIIKNFNDRLSIKYSNGFSLVELLVSVSVFLIFVIALNGTMGTVNTVTKKSTNIERATILSEEGLEAVRNIRDSGNGFSNLPDGTYGLSTSSNIFSLSGSSDISGIFTRVLNITTISGSQKKITSTISWADQVNPINSLASSTYLTDWRAPLNIGLTINKVVAGGVKIASDFLPTILSTTSIDNTQEPPIPININIPIIFSPSTMTLASGTYTFLTSSDPDYTLSLSTSCMGNSIILSNGDAKICTITYTANSIPCVGTPWGTMLDGASNTGYLASSVTYPATCTSEIRTCIAGNLSGTYTNTSCVVTSIAPTVTTTTPVIGITQTTAQGGGNIISNGGATVSVSGLVWGTTLNPTTALSTKTTDGWALGGPWLSNMTSLSCGTIYHVRAYATNTIGTSYGSDVIFSTSTCNVVPTITTPTVTSIGTTTATLGANVTSLGLPASISQRGTCWGITANPTTNCVAEGSTTTGVFTQNRTGFTAGTLYYYRGYAINSTGTAYSADGTFTTIAMCSVASTLIGTPTLYDNAGSVSASVAMPTGVTKDDIMFAYIMHFNATDRLATIPSGWVQIGRHKNGSYNQALYYKVALAGDVGPYVFGLSASSKFAVTISAYRGCFNPLNPIDSSSNIEYVSPNNTTYRAGSVTLSTTNITVLMFPSMYTTAVKTFANPLTQSAGWTEDYDQGATTSSFSRAAYRKFISTIGATGVIDSIGTTGTTIKHAFAVALHPL
ncbi:MAG: prepilin-type N-terminal cleavage/methylation domain-containing protein [bacterium]